MITLCICGVIIGNFIKEGCISYLSKHFNKYTSLRKSGIILRVHSKDSIRVFYINDIKKDILNNITEVVFSYYYRFDKDSERYNYNNYLMRYTLENFFYEPDTCFAEIIDNRLMVNRLLLYYRFRFKYDNYKNSR